MLLFGFLSPLALAGSMAFSALAVSESPIEAQPTATKSDWTRALFRVRRLTPVRAEPRFDIQPLGFLSPGQQILITGRAKDQQWFRVESRDDLEGFVIVSLVRPDEEATLIDLALWPEKPDGTVTLESVPPFDMRDIVPHALSTEDKQQIQKALVYLGYYDGVVDGQFGERTFNAIRDFQRSSGEDPSGQLTFIQHYELKQKANDRVARYAIQTFSNAGAGYRVDYPSSLLPLLERVDNDAWRLIDRDGQVEMLITVGPEGTDLQSVYKLLNVPGQTSYSLLRDRVFVLAGGNGGTRYYHVAKRSGDRLVEIRLTYSAIQSPIWEKYAALLFNSFDVSDD